MGRCSPSLPAAALGSTSTVAGTEASQTSDAAIHCERQSWVDRTELLRFDVVNMLFSSAQRVPCFFPMLFPSIDVGPKSLDFSVSFLPIGSKYDIQILHKHYSIAAILNFSKFEICQEALQLALTRLAGDCQAPNRAAEAVAHWLQNPNGKSGSRTLSGVAAEALEFKASCTTPEDAQDVPQELEEQYEEQWLPGPPSGRGPTCGIFLDPEVKQGGAGREAENFEALSLSALQRRAEPDGELTSLAEREPQVQTLQRLQFILRKLQAKQMNRHHPPAANKNAVVLGDQFLLRAFSL